MLIVDFVQSSCCVLYVCCRCSCLQLCDFCYKAISIHYIRAALGEDDVTEDVAVSDVLEDDAAAARHGHSCDIFLKVISNIHHHYILVDVVDDDVSAEDVLVSVVLVSVVLVSVVLVLDVLEDNVVATRDGHSM